MLFSPPVAIQNILAGRLATIWLAGQNRVVEDVLHIIAIVQQIDELFKGGQIFRANLLACLRVEGDFLNLQLYSGKRFQQCCFRFESEIAVKP